MHLEDSSDNKSTFEKSPTESSIETTNIQTTNTTDFNNNENYNENQHALLSDSKISQAQNIEIIKTNQRPQDQKVLFYMFILFSKE